MKVTMIPMVIDMLGKSTEGIENPYLPNPPLGQDMTQSQFFKRSLIGFNSEFTFSYTSCLTKAEEPSLPNYLPIAGGRLMRFIPFPRVLVLCEMQSASSKIWTRVAVFISYDDNHYTTATSKKELKIKALELRPYRTQHYFDQLEYFKKSRTPENNCYHSYPGVSPPAETGVGKLLRKTMIIGWVIWFTILFAARISRDKRISVADGSRNIARAVRTSTNVPGQICLKPWIPRPCPDSLRQIIR